MTRTRSLFVLASCGASLFALAAPSAAQTAAPATAQAAAPQGVAAVVNGDQIPSRDVERGLNALKRQDPSAQGDSAQAKARLAQYRDTVIDVLVSQRLMAQEAARQKIAPTKEQVDTMMLDFKQANKLKDDKELATYLGKDNKTVADLRRLLTEQLATDKLASNWIADVTVSDADIQAFYTGNPDLFREPEQRRARHILLAVQPGASDAERNKAKARAEALFKQARAKNADFGKLAEKNSDDPGSKAQGGSVGWFGRGMMVQAFEDAAFNAPIGTVVGPVQTAFGFHILKVEEQRASRIIPLADIKNDPRLKEAVLEQKRQKRVDDQVAALKAKAKIQKFG